MAGNSGSIWAIDIGSCSLKALRLTEVEGTVEVIGFDTVAHSKVLSGGIDQQERDELIAMSLRTFVNRNDIEEDEIIVSVPGQTSFSRFVNLPPVEEKRIPEIVKFEAAQQIPFDINEVQWDWQLMGDQDGEKRVGLFAIKSDIVNTQLNYLAAEDLEVGYVQMAPMALYNYILYDQADSLQSDKDAVAVINIGARNTDLVICTRNEVWQRNVSVGGDSFTQAIAETFKLKFQKAEKLKRTAPMSKYARQILQAMKPVFADLSSEIQRSFNFYNNSNPDIKVKKIIAMGGGTRMRGLVKYLQRSLQMTVIRPDSFSRLNISSESLQAKFHDNVCDFGVVYGLGVQALGLGKIESNLLPSNIARSMAWKKKSKLFTAAAILLLVVSVLYFARTAFDKANYSNNEQLRSQAESVLNEYQQASSKLEEQKQKGPRLEKQIEEHFSRYENRDVIPGLQELLISLFPNSENNPQQSELYQAFNTGNVDKLTQIPRKQRQQLFVTSMSIEYSSDISEEQFNKQISRRTNVKAQGGTGAGGYGYGEYGPGMGPGMEPGMGMGRGAQGQRRPTQSRRSTTRGEQQEEEQSGAGFVISIIGYSPYENIGRLIDPAGVGDDKSKWGLVTRLANLDEIVDGNSPYELFQKTNINHFNLDTGEISLEGDTPEGIGVQGWRFETAEGEKIEDKENNDEVLRDPMTNEIISKVPRLDENGEKVIRRGDVVYEVNDHWYKLDFKLLWNKPDRQSEQSGTRRR